MLLAGISEGVGHVIALQLASCQAAHPLWMCWVHGRLVKLRLWLKQLMPKESRLYLSVPAQKALEAKSRNVSYRDILAPGVQYWTVRCQRDKDRLAEYGVLPERITVAADLAWILDPVANDFGRKCLAQWGLDPDCQFVGVNINNERFVLQQEPRLCEKMGMFLDEVIEKSGASILFFCNEIREGETFDRAAHLKVLNHMNRRDKAFLVPNHYWTPQEMLSLIGCCQITVGIRYHFCLFSVLQGVPFIALQRSDKVEDLCWDMNWPYGVSLKNLNVSVLLDMMSEIEQNKAIFA